MSTESRELVAAADPSYQPAVQVGRQTLPVLPHRKATVLWPAIASAALLWACFFPLNCGWLGWVALVPFLYLVRTTAPARRVYLAAWSCGLLYYVPALQWLRVADDRMVFTWAGLALYCALYFPVGLYLLRRLDRRTALPLVLTLPTVWTALEFLRAYLLTGFPWYFLGHSQHDFLPVIQIADLAGAYAVTFLVAAFNALLFEFLNRVRLRLSPFTPLAPVLGGEGLGVRGQPAACSHPLTPNPSPPRTGARGTGQHRPERVLDACRRLQAILCDSAGAPSYRALRSQFIAVVLLLGAALGYGFWRLGQDHFASGPRVALLQGNLPQRIRNDAAAEPEAAAAESVRRHYRNLCNTAANQKPRPDLLVWPETSFPEGWAEVDPALPADRIPAVWNQEIRSYQELAQVLAGHWMTNVLLGVSRASLEADGRPRSFNSAVLIERTGRVGGHYDKIHRVPFGEYVPLRDWLPWMDAFAPYDFDYSISPGESYTHFALDGYHFGVVICYEDTDPALARQYVRPDSTRPAVDFFLNLSNDGWFDGTSEHEQHLAICRFRAVECRRAVARAVNMGISAVIDGNGRVLALPGPDWPQSKKIATVLTAAIPIDQRASLYARWGDWLPWTCWLTIIGGMVWSMVWPRRLSSTSTLESTAPAN